MSEWKNVSIGYVINIARGFAFKSEDYAESGNFILRVSNLQNNGIINTDNAVYLPCSKVEKYQDYLLEINDILLVMVGATTGKFCKVRKDVLPALLNQNLWNLKPATKALDKMFFYYKLTEIIRLFLNESQGSARDFLKQSDFEKQSFMLPTLPEQRKIAEVLSTIDEAIEKTEELIAKYQQIKAGMMHDLFTRGLTSDGKLRPTREQAPELYYETPIGWIPKEWDADYIRRYVKSAEYGISTSLHDLDSGIPVLRMNNIQENAFDLTSLKYSYDSEAYRLKLNPRDVLYNRTNSIEHVGKTAIWEAELDECSFASYLVRINLYEEKLLPEYFSYWMSQVSSQNAIRRFATPAVQQVNINPTNLQKVFISAPNDIGEQKEIVARIKASDSLIISEKDSLHKLRKQKQGLMHDLLTGKVPVSVDEEVDNV